MRFIQRSTLSARALEPVWADLSTNQNSVLTITYGNTKKKITPQQQFETFFYSRQLLDFDPEQACIRFLMIINDETSTFLLQQIKKATEYLTKLSDVDNWQSTTSYVSDNTFHNETHNNITNATIGRMANSDNNSNMDINVIKSFLTANVKNLVNDGIAVEANTMGVNLSNDTNDTTGDSDGTSNTTSTTNVGNLADDILKFFRVEILPIRNRFWSRFECLFRD